MWLIVNETLCVQLVVGTLFNVSQNTIQELAMYFAQFYCILYSFKIEVLVIIPSRLNYVINTVLTVFCLLLDLRMVGKSFDKTYIRQRVPKKIK